MRIKGHKQRSTIEGYEGPTRSILTIEGNYDGLALIRKNTDDHLGSTKED